MGYSPHIHSHPQTRLWSASCSLIPAQCQLSGTILIADDDSNDAILVGIAFREINCPNPLQVVTNGAEAIQYLSGSGRFADRATYPFPVLLLLDLKMPRQNGFDVLRWLNEHPDLRAKLTVVVWSSLLSEESSEAARELGAQALLEKPVSLHALQEQLRSLKERWPELLG